MHWQFQANRIKPNSRKTGREVSDSSCSFKKGEGQRRLDLIDWIPPNQSSAGGEKKKPLIHHAFWKRIAEKVFQYFGLCWSKTRLDIYPSIEDSSSCILYRKKPFLKKTVFFGQIRTQCEKYHIHKAWQLKTGIKNGTNRADSLIWMNFLKKAEND